MPTSERILSMFLRSTTTRAIHFDRPCWCSSSALMQRISVDLPDPDGPQITIRSPGSPSDRCRAARGTCRTTCSCSRCECDLVGHLYLCFGHVSDLLLIGDLLRAGAPTTASIVKCRSKLGRRTRRDASQKLPINTVPFCGRQNRATDHADQIEHRNDRHQNSCL